MPRPSSPVHAKASTKCSYLTLENPHHQRQACIKAALLQVRTIISARLHLIMLCHTSATLRSHQCATASIKNPFTMSKKRANPAHRTPCYGHPEFVFRHWSVASRGQRRMIAGPWWSQSGSNRRPQACKASALPTELWPLKVSKRKWWAWEDSNLRPHPYQGCALTT